MERRKKWLISQSLLLWYACIRQLDTGRDVQMTLLRYLLEYTIEVVCDGNRSACARRMGMEYSELRKIRKRMSEGSGSNRAMEALLEMYWREGLSLDEALRQYSMTELGSDIEARERACNELIRTMRETLQAESDDTQRAAYMLRAAYEFMEKFRHGFCDDQCQRAKYTVVKCPARQLAEFLEWFHKEITEANA